jgi:hypothetical protein
LDAYYWTRPDGSVVPAQPFTAVWGAPTLAVHRADLLEGDSLIEVAAGATRVGMPLAADPDTPEIEIMLYPGLVGAGDRRVGDLE